MKPPRHSDPRPRSAECTLGASVLDAEGIRDMAVYLRRTTGKVLIDPALETDPWFREAIEQVADRQLGASSRRVNPAMETNPEFREWAEQISTSKDHRRKGNSE